jgi:UDP-hydrolysing UDP-N-acetyl-D-glucosamine 2-epimerase
MGEDPSRIFTVGAFGLDALERIRLLDRPELDRALSLPPDADLVAVTFHPTTLEPGSAQAQMAELEAALHEIEDSHIVWTLPNADAENDVIRRRIESFRAGHSDRCSVFESLGQLRYLSLLSHAKAVVGNSSSGIIEAPSLGVRTIDIGDRQRGRPRASSVASCPDERGQISRFLSDALSARERIRVENPYGGPGAARKTSAVLSRHPLEGILKKSFHVAGRTP